MALPQHQASITQMPRSILKKPIQNKPGQRQDEQNRATALHHANLLQQRKDVEHSILASTEALLEIPSLPDADPGNPLPAEAAFVKNSLKAFQPSDYDELIRERNINRQCGYVLCPNANRVDDPGAKYYRIIRGSGKGADSLRIVEKSFLEKWCSNECGRRALYIKVQLEDEPAWTRNGQSSGAISLLDEKPYPTDNGNLLVGAMNRLKMEDKEEEITEKMKALAIERGDGNLASRPFAAAEVDVREKDAADFETPRPPKPDVNASDAADMVEGYAPQHPYSRRRASHLARDEDDDLVATI